MSRAIKSFDVFDTLIARRNVEPRNLLDKLEANTGIPGLAVARLNADRNLGSQGKAWTLNDIWDEVGRTLNLDAAIVLRLRDAEVQLEHEEVIPIVENLALVRDGDVLVSDSYLPADVVCSLSRTAGLDKLVTVVVSNDGKFRGWIWPKLLEECAIQEHFGDNPHSDGETPTQAGIKAIIYTGAKRTKIEQFLVEHGWEALANLVRKVRLANPVPGTRPKERQLWLLSCQMNFPLLFLASLHLEHYVHEAGIREMFFVSRDCMLWHQLYQQLFPHRRSTYLYASRKCLLKPTESYLEYFRSTWHPDSVIVDLFSSGISWSRLFSRLNTKARCFFIGHVDNYAYLQDSVRPDDWLDVHTIFVTVRPNPFLRSRLRWSFSFFQEAPTWLVGLPLRFGNSFGGA
jgi:predicted HAD superfamily hydrolase